MRLLRIVADGTFSLVEHSGTHIPRYAILSHTWGADTEEVTYKDLMEENGSSKVGYNKLAFCARQATQDGLEYFWVDTCCIDKSSSAELAEAINSMFMWYQNATVCYVLIPDLYTNMYGSLKPAWNFDFQNSRWFTRGWTLQELLAPRDVYFFSTDETYIGDKIVLQDDISMATDIPVDVLDRRTSLSELGVEEKMSWTWNRQTKREEDGAYCLFDIFDVHMPLIYGEGKRKAMIRLRKAIQETYDDSLPRHTDLSHVGLQTADTAESYTRPLPAPLANVAARQNETLGDAQASSARTDNAAMSNTQPSTQQESQSPDRNTHELFRPRPLPLDEPSLCLWTIKKAPDIGSWESAVAKRSHKPLMELRNIASRQDYACVQARLKELPSQTAYRRLNKLIQDEDQRTRGASSWFIASLELHWQMRTRRSRQLHTMKVLLKTQVPADPLAFLSGPDVATLPMQSHTLWLMRKRKSAPNWEEDSEVLQQHLSLEFIEQELHEFKQRNASVLKILAGISQPVVHVLLDSLLLEQNRSLERLGASLHWTVVSVKPERRAASGANHSLREVEVILQLSSKAPNGS